MLCVHEYVSVKYICTLYVYTRVYKHTQSIGKQINLLGVWF